jgi:antitoxin FitA
MRVGSISEPASQMINRQDHDGVAINSRMEKPMATLLVRGVDDALVSALRERAAKNGRSAEAEHREILASALKRTKRRSFAQVLASIPEVGEDKDFARTESGIAAI